MGTAPPGTSPPDLVKPAKDGVNWDEKTRDSKDNATVVVSHEENPQSKEKYESAIRTICFRNHPTNPKAKVSPPHEEYRERSPAWGPGVKTVVRATPWGRYHFNRVAEMPEYAPVPGHAYAYLATLDRCPAPVGFCECASCDKASPSSRVSRHLKSFWHTYRARHGADLSVWRRWFTFYTGQQKHTARIIYGVEPREVECPVRGLDDWTTDWTWALAVQHRDPAGKWKADGRFYFNWMHLRLREGVPWRNPQATEKHEMMGPVTVFSDKFKPPRWCAAIEVEQGSDDDPSHVSNPWDFVMPRTVERAQLIMRTGPGRYKRMMWYHRGVGYGNDIERHEPAPCTDDATKAYASFVEPLTGR